MYSHSGKDWVTHRKYWAYNGIYIKTWDFSGGPVVKNPPASAANMDSSPAPGRAHMP